MEPVALTGSLEETGLAGGVYFGREDLDTVRRLFREGAAKGLYDSTLAAADRNLAVDPEQYAGEYAPECNWVGVRSNAKLFPLSGAAQTCGLAFVLSGEKRYADWTCRALLALARTEKWCDGAFARFPQGWGGHGNTFTEGAITYAAGLAHDWVRNALPPPEHEEISTAIMHNGMWWIHDLLKHNPGILKMNQGVASAPESSRVSSSVCVTLYSPPRSRITTGSVISPPFARRSRTASRAFCRLANGRSAVPGFASSPFSATENAAASAPTASATSRMIAPVLQSMIVPPGWHHTVQKPARACWRSTTRCGGMGATPSLPEREEWPAQYALPVQRV